KAKVYDLPARKNRALLGGTYGRLRPSYYHPKALARYRLPAPKSLRCASWHAAIPGQHGGSWAQHRPTGGSTLVINNPSTRDALSAAGRPFAQSPLAGS